MVAALPRHSTDVVDDDDHAELAVLADESEHIVEPATMGELAGHVVCEDADHIMAAMPGIFAATRFL
nr:hypothetical protein [Sphingobium sp. B11D3D]